MVPRFLRPADEIFSSDGEVLSSDAESLSSCTKKIDRMVTVHHNYSQGTPSSTSPIHL